MPFTVITLTKVPPALRGDLTKWMQEIATGVYVGNFSSRVRDNLWKRVCDAAGDGEATISYMFRNEIGYDFKTFNTRREVIDCDGIPLVRVPISYDDSGSLRGQKLSDGFSKASQMYHARRGVKGSGREQKVKSSVGPGDYVVIDVETTGLNEASAQIIELGAVRLKDGELICDHHLIHINAPLPEGIQQLTGITNEMLRVDGENLEDALKKFLTFISDYPLVGYNIHFDIKFINAALRKLSLHELSNKAIDLMSFVKRENLFQADYKLQTSLAAYGIHKEVPHRALEDAKLIYDLSCKVKNFKV